MATLRKHDSSNSADSETTADEVTISLFDRVKRAGLMLPSNYRRKRANLVTPPPPPPHPPPPPATTCLRKRISNFSLNLYCQGNGLPNASEPL